MSQGLVIWPRWGDTIVSGYYYYYYCISCDFFKPVLTSGFYWSLNDSKSPQISRTLLSILITLNNVVIFMLLIRPLISNSFFNLRYHCHDFSSSSSRFEYLSIFSFSFHFVVHLNSKIHLMAINFFINFLSGVLAGTGWYLNPRYFCGFHFICRILVSVGWLVIWVLWHINLCWSFNAKFCLYIHTYSTKDFKTNIKVGRISILVSVRMVKFGFFYNGQILFSCTNFSASVPSLTHVAQSAGGCWIHRLHLCRGVSLPQRMFWIWY